MAEKFIVGFGTEKIPQIFIYNYQAYPVIDIINSVIEDMQSKSYRPYGYAGSKDIMMVSLGRPDNTWLGPNTPSVYWKEKRIKKVKAKIDTLSASASLNFDKINSHELAGILSKKSGVSLNNIVPKLDSLT